MKILGAIVLTSVFLLPNLVLAACVGKGSTVVYLNGILTSEDQAKTDLDALRRKYISQTGDSTIDFINGYNPTHLGGFADLVHASAQVLNSSISTFDRNTILLQIHPQVTTRKVLLVGHSQGAFYANELYDYLLEHGEPKAAMGVYHVGSPASYVAGGGTYLTSSNDSVINAARRIASNVPEGLAPLAAKDNLPEYPTPMKPNITLAASGNGHGFSDAYLAQAPERIVGDLQSALGKLLPGTPSDGECFSAPSAGVGYQTAKAGFAAADAAATGLKAGVAGAQKFGAAVGDAFLAAAGGALTVGKKVVEDIGVTLGGARNLGKAQTNEVRPTTFDIFSKLYGSSLTKEDVAELLAEQGSAVATAQVFGEPAPAGPPGEILGAQVGQEAAPTMPQVSKKITYLSGRESRSGGTDKTIAAGVYSGTVGSSTLIRMLAGPADTSVPDESAYASPSSVFVAAWEDGEGYPDFRAFNTYIIAGSGRLPHQRYAVVPWFVEDEE